MLRTPSKGLRSSVDRHNCRVDILADWIEGSALFTQTRISKTDVVDVLIEESVYRDEDFAREFILDVWGNLEYRLNHGKIRALRIDEDGVTPEGSWDDFPAYSFCLALALRDWCSCKDNSYIEQGKLFERLTECSLVARGWRLLRTGWPATNAKNLRESVERISTHIGALAHGNIEERGLGRSKDVGLDLVCDRPFSDGRGGHPLYFFQCASGRNWRDKTGTPNLRTWDTLIAFTNRPVHGFAIPYVLSTQEFRQVAVIVNGFFLDRLRIIGPLAEDDSQEFHRLKSGLREWLLPRLEFLKPE